MFPNLWYYKFGLVCPGFLFYVHITNFYLNSSGHESLRHKINLRLPAVDYRLYYRALLAAYFNLKRIKHQFDFQRLRGKYDLIGLGWVGLDFI